ncbi:MAG: hypothetical protein OXI05_10280 [Bacteroidota bacterium]|nr:hypothetical protein [Bacteroidota bacterium]MXW14976.1 hypothetical protein [Rhodothermaceae bacterium]MDE2646204.1 hypothetical protein [Bacteroidota bacterium]MXW31790.1 hypothetical protein [Rhodothermaceae bacterium]MYC05059.1 hypothetical protein [Rhodothermaceae bacterium]
MSLAVGILLALIGYLILKAVWRIYKVLGIGQPKQDLKPRRPSFRDEFGEDYEMEDARWRDIP